MCFSIGYFLYDFFDMFLYTWHKRSTKEMLVHHLTVVTCFGIAAVNKTYVAYAAISLVVEVNSVFLHGRQLLKFAGKTHTTVRFINFSYRIFSRIFELTYTAGIQGPSTRLVRCFRNYIDTRTPSGVPLY